MARMTGLPEGSQGRAGSRDLEDLDSGRPSKSARKRAATSLQDLGVELAALAEPELEALDLPESLAAAFAELQRLTSHGAQLRQRQYIGKLMRKIDAEPLRAKLAERRRLHDVEVRRFQQIERWRERLVTELDAAIPELLERCPDADRGALERLAKQALHERAEGRSPAAARELFALLKELLA